MHWRKLTEISTNLGHTTNEIWTDGYIWILRPHNIQEQPTPNISSQDFWPGWKWMKEQTLDGLSQMYVRHLKACARYQLLLYPNLTMSHITHSYGNIPRKRSKLVNVIKNDTYVKWKTCTQSSSLNHTPSLTFFLLRHNKPCRDR